MRLPEQARAALKREICHTPGNPAAMGELAQLSVGSRDAPTWSRRGLSVAPAVPDLLALHAISLAKLNSRTEALTAARRCQSLAPSHGINAATVAVLLSEAGCAIDSIHWSRRALTVDRHSDIALRQLAISLANLRPDAESSRRLFGGFSGAWYLGDARRRACSRQGYLVIKPWGVGFWGEIDHVATQIVIASILGREPIVLWNGEYRYGKSGAENAWNDCFLPVSEAARGDLNGAGLTFYPSFWSSTNLDQVRYRPGRDIGHYRPFGGSSLMAIGRQEDIIVADAYVNMRAALAWAPPEAPIAKQDLLSIYRSIFRDVIRPLPEHVARHDAIAAQLFARRPVLAIHYRAQSAYKTFAESIEKRALTMEEYVEHIDRFVADHPQGGLFLLSDLKAAVEQLRSRYGDRLVTMDRARLSDPGLVDIAFDQAGTSYALGLEVFDDACLAARADRFLGDGTSGVSCAIEFMKDWPEGSVTLLRKNVFLHR